MSSKPHSKRYCASDDDDIDAITPVDGPYTGPTIKDGKITKPVVVDARQTRASNIHTLNDAREKRTANLLATERIANRKASYPENTYAAIAAADKTKENEPSPYSSSYKGKEKETNGPNLLSPFSMLTQEAKDGFLAPHMRGPPQPGSQGFQADRQHALAVNAAQQAADVQKADLEKPYKFESNTILGNIEELPEPTEEPSKPRPTDQMNSGSASKSAAKDSKFPCTFKDCSQGFSRSKDLKRHKKVNHEYCDVCDIDFKDDRALIEHRKEVTIAADNSPKYGKHCACLVCGTDFNCMAGRIRHTKLAHPEIQELQCPGCSEVFTRGASLLAHVYKNRCKDRSGLVSMTNFQMSRITAALALDKMLNADKYGTEGETSTMASSKAPSVVENAYPNDPTPSLLDEEDGGVSIQDPSLARKCGKWMENNYMYDEATISEGPGDYETLSDNETVASTLPRPVSEVLNMRDLNMAESSNTAVARPTWNKHLFGDAKPTPNTTHWMQPKRQAPAAPRRQIPETVNDIIKLFDMATNRKGDKVDCDWDVYKFENDNTGRVICPFLSCHCTFPNIGAVKSHLISGYHDTSSDKCPKCTKEFKGAIGLLAHMESPTTKCNIRDTPQYGHYIWAISGGFVDVNDDERGTNLPDGQLRFKAPTKDDLIVQKEVNDESARQRDAARLEKDW